MDMIPCIYCEKLFTENEIDNHVLLHMVDVLLDNMTRKLGVQEWLPLGFQIHYAHVHTQVRNVLSETERVALFEATP